LNKLFTKFMVFIAVLSLVGAGFVLHSQAKEKRMFVMQIPGGTLAPGDVPKFVTDLVKPPAMPMSRGSNKTKDKYRIAVRQFQQQILPALDENGNATGLPMTTVWSYGSIDYPGTVAEGGTFFYPSFTIEATFGKETQVLWRNDLKDEMGNYLPHLLPVDPTLHWANPPGGIAGRDTRPTFTTTPGPYTGPVPMITHVHGAHTYEQFDGYPEAWYLPEAKNIPAGYATAGTFYDFYKAKYGESWAPGTVSFKYPNDQRATTLWYHDHTLGMTRLNVYAGPAGFYIIRGGPDDLPLGYVAPGVGDGPFGEYTEIPIAIQDRSFNTDGSLFYPDTREFFDDELPPYIPDSSVPPIWQPEFFGNMMVVNGRTWPYLEVNQQRYRFRLLDGCNSRFLILDFSDIPGVQVWQIGAEGGFLAAPYDITAGGNTLLMSPAERADIIIDFANVPDGEYVLKNIGPDEPFGGGTPGLDFDPADPDSTGQVMQFRVRSGAVDDPTDDPANLVLPEIVDLGVAGNTRQLALIEETAENDDPPRDIPIAALLGTYDADSDEATPYLWSDPITEDPAVGSVEEWEIYNTTEDAHPIHIHLVQFQVIHREAIGGGASVAGSNNPLPWETGFKDTVTAYPGEKTVVKARFDIAGLFVWHCHIVEHEDNEMMRPYSVGPYVMPAGVELRRIK
jgi:spore coat protein A